jgi:hypothetical protein
MAQQEAEKALKAMVAAEGLDLRKSYEHRLQATFIWRRALLLSDGLAEQAFRDRLRTEFLIVKGFVNEKLGADRTSGPMVPVRGGVETVSPHHIDLQDTVRQRVSDLSVDLAGSSSRAQRLKQSAKTATADRIRRVLMIVWRATCVEKGLWNDAKKPVPILNAAALSELLDRRLHIVERMAYNVTSQNEMLGLRERDSVRIGRWDLSDATPTAEWRDGLRVRLFEYPYVPAFFLRVIANAQLGTTWVEQSGLGGEKRLAYNVRRVGTRTYTDQTTEQVAAMSSWRFPPDVATAWKPSPGSLDFGRFKHLALSYRIDLSSAGTASSVIDKTFDYSGTAANGSPLRADFWNRAWLFCDHVVALLQIEALLFARRRRIGKAAADAEFNTKADLKVLVEVPKSDGAPGEVNTNFVSLDKHIYAKGPPRNGIMMAAPDIGGNIVDVDFENQMTDPHDLQVGDQVIIANTLLHQAFNRESEWGFENAVVMDVDTGAGSERSAPDRLRLEALGLQGHGTKRLTHAEYKALMADIVRPSYETLLQRLRAIILAPPSTGLPKVLPFDRTGYAAIQWTPFDDLSFCDFGEGPLVSSGPWWIPRLALDIFQTVDEAVSAIPKAVGGKMIRSAPGEMVVNPLPREGDFQPGADFFEKFVLFPLFEPIIRVDAADRDPWSVYFRRKKAGGTFKANVRRLEFDSTLIPGISLRGANAALGVVKPRVRVL